MASKQNPAPKHKAADEITYLRPVSNCSGCGDTKISWSVREGMRRFNQQLKLKGKDKYELIYARLWSPHQETAPIILISAASSLLLKTKSLALLTSSTTTTTSG